MPHVFGSCQHQKSPILDQVIQHLQQSSITKREFCAEGSVRNDDKTDDDCKMPQASLKSLHDAYTTVSYTDIYCRAMRQRCANEDMRGNTYWHLEDKAEEAIDALEALVLSVSGVCQKDREGKQNASSVEKETAGPSDDDNPTRNNCYSRYVCILYLAILNCDPSAQNQSQVRKFGFKILSKKPHERHFSND